MILISPYYFYGQVKYKIQFYTKICIKFEKVYMKYTFYSTGNGSIIPNLSERGRSYLKPIIDVC